MLPNHVRNPTSRSTHEERPAIQESIAAPNTRPNQRKKTLVHEPLSQNEQRGTSKNINPLQIFTLLIVS